MVHPLKVGVGSTVWVFDEGRRIYTNGLATPVWREHWRPVKIAVETSRSWVLETPVWFGKDVTRIPKHGPSPWWVMFTQEQVDDAVWVHNHRHKIGEAIRYVDDPAILKQVARLVGYSEEVT